MAVTTIIVSGKLDYADGGYLVTDDRTLQTRYLRHYIDPYVGKRIVISLVEPEKELEPAIKRRLERVAAGA